MPTMLPPGGNDIPRGMHPQIMGGQQQVQPMQPMFPGQNHGIGPLMFQPGPPQSVSFVDTEGDTSTLRLDTATRQLSWHAGGRCYLQNIGILEFDAARAAIIAPEHSALTARLVDPPAGLERVRLIRSIAVMARSANAVQLRGFKETSAFGVEWQEGDVLGLACDMVNKTVSFSVNGSFEPPLGLAFENIAADFIAPAFTANSGFKVVANFGQLPLKHAPPDETYVSVHAAAQNRV